MLDEKEGFKTVRGKQAAEKANDYKSKFDNEILDIEKSLTNPEQINQFRSLSERVYRDVDNQMQGHIFGEIRNYENEQSKASLAIVQNDALVNYKQPGKVKESLDLQKELINSQAERNGLSPEAKKSMMLAATTQTHSQIISRMVNGGDDQLAKEYYSQSKSELTGEAQAKIETVLNKSSIIGESQRQTDALLSQGLNQTDALAQARKIEDPKLRDETVRRLRNRYSERSQVAKMESNERYEKSFDILSKTKSLDSIPPSELASMTASEEKALRAYEKQLKSGAVASTDIKVYYQLEQLAGENKKAFKDQNLLLYADKLTPQDLKKFSRMQSVLRGKGNDEDRKLFDGVESKLSIANNAMKEIGITRGSGASEDDIAKANTFMKRLDEIVVDKQAELGRKLSNKELRQVTSDLKVEVITDDGWVFDTTKRVFELTRDDVASIDFDDIPQDEVDKIKSALRRNGIEATEDEITSKYAVMLNRRVKRDGA